MDDAAKQHKVVVVNKDLHLPWRQGVVYAHTVTSVQSEVTRMWTRAVVTCSRQHQPSHLRAIFPPFLSSRTKQPTQLPTTHTSSRTRYAKYGIASRSRRHENLRSLLQSSNVLKTEWLVPRMYSSCPSRSGSSVSSAWDIERSAEMMSNAAWSPPPTLHLIQRRRIFGSSTNVRSAPFLCSIHRLHTETRIL